MSGTKRTIVGFYFERRGETTFWDLKNHDFSEPINWRGVVAWRGEHEDRKVWIYVGQEYSVDADEDDLIDVAQPLAEAELARVYPGALVAR